VPERPALEGWGAVDVLFLVGERWLFKRCGGVKDPWMAFMLEEARKRSTGNAAVACLTIDAAVTGADLLGRSGWLRIVCVGELGELGEWCCDRESSALTLSKARASSGRYGQQPRSVRHANHHFNHTNVTVTMYRRSHTAREEHIGNVGGIFRRENPQRRI
jgi:hypothetical protein